MPSCSQEPVTNRRPRPPRARSANAARAAADLAVDRSARPAVNGPACPVPVAPPGGRPRTARSWATEITFPPPAGHLVADPAIVGRHHNGLGEVESGRRGQRSPRRPRRPSGENVTPDPMPGGWRRPDPPPGVGPIEDHVHGRAGPHGQFRQGIDETLALARQLQVGPRRDRHVVAVDDQQHPATPDEVLGGFEGVVEDCGRQRCRPAPFRGTRNGRGTGPGRTTALGRGQPARRGAGPLALQPRWSRHDQPSRHRRATRRAAGPRPRLEQRPPTTSARSFPASLDEPPPPRRRRAASAKRLDPRQHQVTFLADLADRRRPASSRSAARFEILASIWVTFWSSCDSCVFGRATGRLEVRRVRLPPGAGSGVLAATSAARPAVDVSWIEPARPRPERRRPRRRRGAGGRCAPPFPTWIRPLPRQRHP